MGRNRGGTKVPGVKLRPANAKPAQAKKNVVESDEDDDVVPPTPQRALLNIFKDVVLCATGIKNKREVFDLVKRMGGTHSTDFTDMTTHLLAEAPGSLKYKCAIERGIPVLDPSWVYEAHQRWVAGEIFSPDTLLDSHRLLPFRGVRLCVTGIDVADVRARVHKLTKLNGGEYIKNLDKTCTHVLCATSTSEKVVWTNKVNREREVAKLRSGLQDIPDPIQLVWEEWFWDCIYLKGLLDCQPYHLSKQRPEPMSRDVMRSPEAFTTALPQPKLPPSVPLANLLCDPGDSIVQVKRKKGAGIKEWESIVNRQGYTVLNGEMRNVGPSSYSMELDESIGQSSTSPMKKRWAPNNQEPQSKAKGWSRRSPSKRQAAFGTSDLSSSPRKPLAIQLPSDGDKAEPGPQSAVSFLGKMSRTSAFDDEIMQRDTKPAVIAEASPSQVPKQVFGGVKVYLLGDAACDAVSKAVTGAGGEILTEGLPDYYIVRLVGGDQHMLSLSEVERSKFRTECWLERSLFEKRLCDVTENLTYAPIIIQSPLDGNLLVALSGLDTFERTWVSRLLRLLGVQISASFSAQCTHLLCPTRDGIKCKKADQWNIPVVDLDWLKQLTEKAITNNGTRTPSPQADAGQSMPMERSLEALKLDIKAPAPSLELLSRQGAISPVFKVATPNGALERPPSPKSPSPQGKRAIQPRTGISEATNISSKANQPSPAKTVNQTPTRPPLTQRIPSSASPSPLRTQGPVAPTKGPIIMPSALSLQLTSAKALSRNIGAVLGSKRSAEDDSDSGAGSSVATTEDGPRKRPRRPQSNLARNLKESSPKKLTLTTIAPNYGHEANSHPDGNSGSSLSMMESPSESLGGIVVNYTDPNEAEEQKRLRMLLNGEDPQEEEPVTKGKRPTKASKPRRSGRLRV